MKKTIIILLSAAAVAFSSCDKYLDQAPLSEVSPEQYLSNEQNIDTYVIKLSYIIHSGFISGYQNRYGDNLKPPTNVYHRMTA